MKVKKYQLGGGLNSKIFDLSQNYNDFINQRMLQQTAPGVWKNGNYENLGSVNQTTYKDYLKSLNKNNNKTNTLVSSGIDLASNYLSGLASDQIFGDSDLGRGFGTLFSSGLSSTVSTMGNNLLKGTSLLQGLGKNLGGSLAGAGVGLAANYLGQGISSLGGDTPLSKALGAGISHGIGAIGGTAASAAVTGKNVLGALKTINPLGLGMGIVGSALSAGFGPSKEYGGKYGGITQGMDIGYDTATLAANFIPGAGQIVSGAMALNKGLSNIFGSTDGMTVQDAILGSAFMPAPVKWINMIGANKTDNFRNQSWQNSEKVNSFMGSSFGNLGDKFDKAREEAGKTYGTFSQGAYEEAQKRIQFANDAWSKVLAMADQNELQDIRSQIMSSINNQRYAQNVSGGLKRTAVGKQGMKIFNNATNHNIGMRLLSGAALIDNKQMILCSVID